MLDGDFGAVASVIIEKPPAIYQEGSSSIELNGRSLIRVMPLGSFDEPGGGGGGGACTVTVAVPVFVSLVAVIVVAGPAASVVTRPEVELTEAMFGFALDHVTTRPVSTLPLASRMVADS